MKHQKQLAGFLIFSFLSWIPNARANPVPLPVKKKVTITSVTALENLWDGLSEKEKRLAYHLQRAARAGRSLLFFQNHRHALWIQEALEASFNKKNIEKTRELFGSTPEGQASLQELMTYLALFEDQGGPYATSNRKYVLQKVSAHQLTELFKRVAPQASEALVSEVVQLMTDPTSEVIHRPEDPNGSDLVHSGGNIYQKGLTGTQVQEALDKGLKVDLNCRLVLNPETKQVACQKMTTSTPGIVGKTLARVVFELKRAVPYATTEHQKKEILALIQYFIKGDQESFRKASIEWVLDRTASKVDFMMGFVEVYDDYKGNVGTWESYVQIVDPVTTKTSQLLAQNAQYFENQMPYGIWKKTFPADYSPPALMVYYFQEIAGMRSGGYNLPNFDDIRRDVGAKNVIRLPLPGEAEDPARKAMLTELYQTFGPKDRAESLVSSYQKQRLVLVLLHEIIGHGSGLYDTKKYAEKEDPISALGSSGSSLEEQRADLAALVFAADPKLVEVGIYHSKEEAHTIRNAMYDIYLIDFLRLISKEHSFSESHMRGHWLLIKRLLDQKAIEWTSTDLQSQILVVKDYDAFWNICKGLLGELQGLKANREVQKLETLFKEGAPLEEINSPWAQAILKRGENLMINAGSFQQNWNITRNLGFAKISDLTLGQLTESWHRTSYTGR